MYEDNIEVEVYIWANCPPEYVWRTKDGEKTKFPPGDSDSIRDGKTVVGVGSSSGSEVWLYDGTKVNWMGGIFFVYVPDCKDLRVAQFVKTDFKIKFCPIGEAKTDEEKKEVADIEKEVEKELSSGWRIDVPKDDNKYDSKTAVEPVEAGGEVFCDTPSEENPNEVRDKFIELNEVGVGVESASQTSSFLTFVCCGGKVIGIYSWTYAYTYKFNSCKDGGVFQGAVVSISKPVKTDAADAQKIFDSADKLGNDLSKWCV